MNQLIIVDLDNCISDDSKRIPLIDWSKTDPDERYAAYHRALGEDPSANLDRIADVMCACESPRIAVLTARPEGYRRETQDWLRKTSLAFPSHLMMRKEGDHRASVSVKRDMVEQLRKIWAPSQFVFAADDKQDIVDMYREYGIPAHRLWIHEADAYAPPSQVLSAMSDAQFEVSFDHASVDIGSLSEPLRLHMKQFHFETDPVEFDSTAKVATDVPSLLEAMAATYRERNAVYGDNFKMVGPIMKILFPEGVTPELLGHDAFHLFELAVVKLSRLAISQFTHTDSAHDAAVYCAMIESIIRRNEDV